MVEITKMSSKGQVVIPARIRDELRLEEGSRLLVDRSGSAIILKKLSIPEALGEFDKIVKRGEQFARKKGIKSEEDLVKIVHERRKKRRAEGSS